MRLIVVTWSTGVHARGAGAGGAYVDRPRHTRDDRRRTQPADGARGGRVARRAAGAVVKVVAPQVSDARRPDASSRGGLSPASVGAPTEAGDDAGLEAAHGAHAVDEALEVVGLAAVGEVQQPRVVAVALG